MYGRSVVREATSPLDFMCRILRDIFRSFYLEKKLIIWKIKNLFRLKNDICYLVFFMAGNITAYLGIM